MTPQFLELIKQGGLLALAAAEMAAIVVLWRRLALAQDARVQEIQKITEALISNARLVETLEKVLEAFTRRR